jgi:flagellar hook-associated protein FlgK
MSLFDSLNISSSGLNAGGALLSAAASNIANANSLNYTPESVDLAEVPGAAGAGVEIVELSGGAGPAGAGSIAADNDPVDIANAIELKRAEIIYDANAVIIAAQQQMFGSLIDMTDTSNQSQPPDEEGDSVL